MMIQVYNFRFSPATLKKLYRGFKAECPSGVSSSEVSSSKQSVSPGLLTEEVFKQVFAKFFPIESSSHLYFHYVFLSIDTQQTGNINFEA